MDSTLLSQIANQKQANGRSQKPVSTIWKALLSKKFNGIQMLQTNIQFPA